MSSSSSSSEPPTSFLSRALIPYKQTLANLVSSSTLCLLLLSVFATCLFPQTLVLALPPGVLLPAACFWLFVHFTLLLALSIARGDAGEAVGWICVFIVGPLLLSDDVLWDARFTVGVVVIVWATGMLRPYWT